MPALVSQPLQLLTHGTQLNASHTAACCSCCSGLNESFGLVPIPSRMRYELAALAVIVYNVSWLLETGLRKRFPAPVPPRKGYEAHAAELRKLQKGQATSKKTQ